MNVREERKVMKKFRKKTGNGGEKKGNGNTEMSFGMARMRLVKPWST